MLLGRGRNGKFTVQNYTVEMKDRDLDMVQLSFGSVRKGSNDPIIILGPRVEIMKMLEDINERLQLVGMKGRAANIDRIRVPLEDRKNAE